MQRIGGLQFVEGRNNRILEIDSLAIYFGGLKAIDGVSLYIEKKAA